MNNSLFLHYGPGGNSFVEKEILGKANNQIVFWDQPTVRQLTTPFSSLVSLCEKKIEELKSPPLIIAHSFGCNIISSILNTHPQNESKLILISPLINIPNCFINLAKILNSTKELPQLKDELLKIHSTSNKSAIGPEVFWRIVRQIIMHPNYSSTFWHSHKCYQDYLAVNANSPNFDSEEWQVVINDYLFTQAQKINFNILQNSNSHIILGEFDPYYTKEDFHFWYDLVGKERVTIIPSTGHFPHLENSSAFLNLIS
jgi:pimeloyl-ACP methyl ester carboxylesterase